MTLDGMNAELERRWRNHLSPFDGFTISPADLLPVPRLRRALAAIVEHFERERPQASLKKLMDWHEHDGFITDSEPTNWAEVQSWVETENDLIAHCSPDDYVRVGIAADDWEFYFRFYLDEQERVGDFDVTGPRELVEEIGAILSLDLRCEPAKVYFDSRYAG